MSNPEVDSIFSSQAMTNRPSWHSIIFKGLLTGLISGTALGLFCKAVEEFTKNRIYTLLLNVDFIEFVPQPLPEWIEFSLHLLVSLGLGMCYCLWVQISSSPRPWRIAILLGLATSLLYFPLSLASDRVPEVTDLTALLWWITGHLFYGVILGLFGRSQGRGEIAKEVR